MKIDNMVDYQWTQDEKQKDIELLRLYGISATILSLLLVLCITVL